MQLVTILKNTAINVDIPKQQVADLKLRKNYEMNVFETPNKKRQGSHLSKWC